jgi:hypothetical protein
MVAPWDEVSASLKPAFALTGDQAAGQVLPNTEAITEQVLNAFGASLAVGLPTTSAASKTILGGSTPGTTTTITKSPGTAPTITNTIPSGATLPSEAGAAGTLGLDPVLKYKAANYLLQEVQLLNQEIDNAANRSCYVPYVVKLKLAVMNFRPSLPYSVHAHIGFFYNGALASRTRPATNSPNLQLPNPSPELANECQVAGINPAVVPLLVADDVQTALLSRAAEAATQLSFGLSALIQGAGIGANVGSMQQNLTAITNHELTSSLTVGREAENSLYALITPNNQASNAADLVSQTYDVAVLLLIPRFYFSGVNDPQSPIISVSTYSEYRDATTGAVLESGSSDALIAQAERIIPPHLTAAGLHVWQTKLTRADKLNEARLLADSVKAAGAQLFLSRIRCQIDPNKDPSGYQSKLCDGNKPYISDWMVESLYTDAASLLDYDVEKLALFQAQLPTPIKIPSQEILLSDDGNNPIQVVLGGVSGRSVAKLNASLLVTPFDVKAWKSETPVRVPAQTLVLDSTAHTLTATFPSLKKLNITCLSPVEIPPKPTPPPVPPGAPAAAPAPPPAVTAAGSPAPLGETAGAPAPAPASPPAPPPALHAGAKQAGAPAKPAGAANGTAKTPDCPTREADAGTVIRPNGILLQLVGCDPEKQLCPSLTDTSIPSEESGVEEGSGGWLLNKHGHLLAAQQLLRKDIEDKKRQSNQAMLRSALEATAKACPSNDRALQEGLQAVAKACPSPDDALQRELIGLMRRDSQLTDLLTALAAAASASDEVTIAQRAIGNASPKDKALAAKGDQLHAARTQWRAKWDDVRRAAITANLSEYIEDHATIGVSLYSSPQSTNPAKVAVTNVGQTIPYDSSGAGQLVITVSPTPATDTVNVSVSGASLRSILDATGSAIAFNAKHGFVLPAAGVYTLNLMSLNDKHPVALVAQALKGDANDGQSLTQNFLPTAPQWKPTPRADQPVTKSSN